MRERSVIAASTTAALLLAHCAWITPGVGVEVSLRADDAPGPLLDARGVEHTLARATLRVASLELLPCPGASPLALLALGPARARAHLEAGASLGPFIVDLLDPTVHVVDRLEPMPGEYCDVRITVAPAGEEPTLSLEGDSIAVTSRVTREHLVRIERVSLTEDAREAALELSFSLDGALSRVDPAAPDEVADGASALGAVLRGVGVE